MSYINFGFNTIKNNSDIKNSYNFIFIAEGFAAVDMPVFNAKCIDLMNTIINCQPWTQKAYLFNFFSIPVISPQSGLTHPFTCGAQCSGVIPPMPQQFVNSYFGLSFDQDGLHRFILPTNAQTINIMNTIAASMPLYKLGGYNFEPIVICNHSGYGGSETGSVACTTLNVQSDEVCLHELGHSVAALNDEYIGGDTARSWNTDTTNDLTKILWKSIVPPAGAIQIGTEKLWKGFATCKMNTLGVPYCAVCSNQILISINELISMSGGVPPLPPVNPPIPPTPPSGTNSMGINFAVPPTATKVLLQCNRDPNAFIYVFNLYDSTGKIAVQHYQESVAPNDLVQFTGLTTKTNYNATAYVVYKNGTHTPESTPFNFTTP